MKNSNFLRRLAVVAIALSSVLVFSSFTSATNPQEESKSSLLSLIVEKMKETLPLDLGSGMAMTDVYLTSNFLVVECTCSETLVDLIRVGYKEMSREEAVKEILGNEAVKVLAKFCAECNYGMRYAYTNKTRTNICEMNFTVEELKMIP